MIYLEKIMPNNRIRFYKINIYKSLFNEYVVERVYGSLQNTKPTGIRKDIFSNKNTALKLVKNITETKIKKGYKNVEFRHSF